MAFQLQNRYEIIVGLNDMQSHREEISAEDVIRYLVNFLEKMEIAFSLLVQNGGYCYSDKEYVGEKSLVLNFIGADEGFVDRLCNMLKMLLNQEKILVRKREIEVMYA